MNSGTKAQPQPVIVSIIQGNMAVETGVEVADRGLQSRNFTQMANFKVC